MEIDHDVPRQSKAGNSGLKFLGVVVGITLVSLLPLFVDQRATTQSIGQVRQQGKADPLALSKLQQEKFNRRAPLLKQYFDHKKRYSVRTGNFSSLILNEEYAYLHIWKNGGTTMELQTNRSQTSITDPAIQNRTWIAVVRDPVSHFLSGWAECGHRANKDEKLLSRYTNLTYDQRIQKTLKVLTEHAVKPSKKMKCERHSAPQANFMMVRGKIAPQLKIVGDLREFPAVLESVGFPFNTSIDSGRNASASDFRREYFAPRIDHISNTTMQSLCRLLAIDYFLFDFEPPEVCQDLPQFQEWKDMDNTVTGQAKR